MAQLPEHFHPSSADSAGQPWAGREFPEATPFGDDDGSMPEAYRRIHEAFRAGETGQAQVATVLRDLRVLIPLVAEIGEAGVNDQGVIVDKSADLSIVTVSGPNGSPVLPVFTSTETMRAWNADARPVPVEMRRALLAAVAEQTNHVIVDPGSETEFGLRRPATWALAQGQDWTPPWENAAVTEALERAMGAEPDVVGINLGRGSSGAGLEGPEVVIRVVFLDSLAEAKRTEIVQRLGAAWQDDETLRTAIDSLAITIGLVSADVANAMTTGAAGDTNTKAPGMLRRLFGRGHRGNSAGGR